MGSPSLRSRTSTIESVIDTAASMNSEIVPNNVQMMGVEKTSLISRRIILSFSTAIMIYNKQSF